MSSWCGSSSPLATLTAATDLCRAEDDVHAAIGADNVAHLADVQTVGCVLKRLLHLTLMHAFNTLAMERRADDIHPAEAAKVSAIPSG